MALSVNNFGPSFRQSEGYVVNTKCYLILLCLFGSNGTLLWILEIKQFNIKDKSRVWWNKSGKTTWTVGVVCRTSQFCSLTLCHLGNSIVPTLDYFSEAKWESKWLSTIAT